MSGRRADVLARGGERIRGDGGQAEVEALDVSDAEAVKRAADAILARHGRIDILLNSAGLNTPKRLWKNQIGRGLATASSASTSTARSTRLTRCCRRCAKQRTG